MQELFLHGTITTSVSKASAIKGQIDKVINLAKNKNSQKLIQPFFSNKLLQDRIIKEIAPKLSNRNSGYTSLVKMGVQNGDNTTVVKMSLIGLEELKPLEKKEKSLNDSSVKKELTEKNVTAPKVKAAPKKEAKPVVKKTTSTKKVGKK